MKHGWELQAEWKMGWSGNGLTGMREGREDIANGPVELRLVCGGRSSQEIHLGFVVVCTVVFHMKE